MLLNTSRSSVFVEGTFCNAGENLNQFSMYLMSEYYLNENETYGNHGIETRFLIHV